MKYARITPEGYLESTIFTDQEIEQGCTDGFKPVIECEIIPDTIGLQGAEQHFEETETSIVVSYIVVENHPDKVNAEIKYLKTTLSDDDYKITKCQEYALAGLPLPYNITQLHADREELRARINELQVLIKKS